MTWEAALALGLTLVSVILMAREWLSAELSLLGCLVTLMTFGVIEPEDALSGFGSPALLTIGALFIVAAAVRRTGALTSLASVVLGAPGQAAPVFRMVLPVGLLSAFLNNTPIVAMFASPVLEWCKRQGVPPSRMLMPLSFASVIGGTCTLIGTSTTLVVDGMLRKSGHEGLTMFAPLWIGGPLLVFGALYMGLGAHRLLPDRSDPVQRLDEQKRTYFVEMIVEATSPLVACTIEEAGLRNLNGLFLMAIERQTRTMTAVPPHEVLLAGDRLVFTGLAASVVDLRRFSGLSPSPDYHYDPLSESRRNRLYEVVISSTSPLVNTTVRDIGFRQRYDAAVLAIHRSGERLPAKIGEVRLKSGDTLMLEASKSFGATWSDSSDFALVSRVRSDPPPQPAKARLVFAVTAGMVAAATFEVFPMVVAALLAVGVLLVTDAIPSRSAFRALDLQVLTTVGAALGVGRALQVSGAADWIASQLLLAGEYGGPIAGLALTYLLTAVLTELVTNVAAVAIMFPIALEVSLTSGMSVTGTAVAIAVAGSASFLTPTGYQTNLIVYGPGGYRFGDFARFGFPLTIGAFVLTVILVPIVWPA